MLVFCPYDLSLDKLDVIMVRGSRASHSFVCDFEPLPDRNYPKDADLILVPNIFPCRLKSTMLGTRLMVH